MYNFTEYEVFIQNFLNCYLWYVCHLLCCQQCCFCAIDISIVI